MTQYRSIELELELETMRWLSRPPDVAAASPAAKCLSDGELAERSAQLIGLLDCCRIQHSTAGHAAAAAALLRQELQARVLAAGAQLPQPGSSPAGRVWIRARCFALI